MTPNPAMPLRVYLIRHGQTAWSLSGQHTGKADIPLTAHGEDEARTLVPRLRDIHFSHVLSSPRQRAHKTCELAQLKTATVIDPDMAEWDYGDDEGRTSKEILALRPGWNLFRDGAPNGETPDQMTNRVDRVIARLRAMSGNVAIFSHGHFGRVFGARWIGAPVTFAQSLLLSTASLSVLAFEHDRTDKPAIALWNSTAKDVFDSSHSDANASAERKRT